MISKIATFLNIVLYIIIITVTYITLYPWKPLLSGYIEAMMMEQGFENPKLSVSKITSNTIYLNDITAGAESQLTLTDLTIRYVPEELQNGKVRDLNINELQLSIAQNEDGWQVQGLNFKPSDGGGSSSMPLTSDDLPFDTLNIINSRFMLSGEGWNGTIPFSLSMHDDLSVTSRNASFNYNEMSVDIADVNMSALLTSEGDGLAGTWTVKGLSMPPSPVFDMNGSFTLDSQTFSISGKAQAKDESDLKVSFSFSYAFSDPQSTVFILKNMSMPWGGGALSVKNVSIPVWGKGALTFPVRAHKVSIDDLMRLMTGEYVRATGTLSGVIPVVVGRDSSVSLGSGTLKADRKGSLSMPPDVIPGQGSQIEMTRDILGNFHYDGFEVEVQKEGRDKISVFLALKGNNPDMYNGRAVHLNVRLGGDVLDFIRSNVMMIMQPETLLDQEQK